jgi:hypothetical protein
MRDALVAVHSFILSFVQSFLPCCTVQIKLCGTDAVELVQALVLVSSHFEGSGIKWMILDLLNGWSVERIVLQTTHDQIL